MLEYHALYIGMREDFLKAIQPLLNEGWQIYTTAAVVEDGRNVWAVIISRPVPYHIESGS